MSKHVIVDENPERQRDWVVDVWRVRNYTGERCEVELLAEDDDSVFSVDNCDEEQREANDELHAVINAIF